MPVKPKSFSPINQLPPPKANSTSNPAGDPGLIPNLAVFLFAQFGNACPWHRCRHGRRPFAAGVPRKVGGGRKSTSRVPTVSFCFKRCGGRLAAHRAARPSCKMSLRVRTILHHYDRPCFGAHISPGRVSARELLPVPPLESCATPTLPENIFFSASGWRGQPASQRTQPKVLLHTHPPKKTVRLGPGPSILQEQN